MLPVIVPSELENDLTAVPNSIATGVLCSGGHSMSSPSRPMHAASTRFVVLDDDDDDDDDDFAAASSTSPRRPQPDGSQLSARAEPLAKVIATTISHRDIKV